MARSSRRLGRVARGGQRASRVGDEVLPVGAAGPLDVRHLQAGFHEDGFDLLSLIEAEPPSLEVVISKRPPAVGTFDERDEEPPAWTKHPVGLAEGAVQTLFWEVEVRVACEQTSKREVGEGQGFEVAPYERDRPDAPGDGEEGRRRVETDHLRTELGEVAAGAAPGVEDEPIAESSTELPPEGVARHPPAVGQLAGTSLLDRDGIGLHGSIILAGAIRTESSVGDLGRETERVTGRVEKDPPLLRVGLVLGEACAERDSSLHLVLELGDGELEVELLRPL